MRRPWGNTRPWWLLGGLLILLGLQAGAPRAAGADSEKARVLAVDPVVTEGRLQGRLRTAGLPTEKQLQSMRSGLVAAVELHLALQDEADAILASRRLMLRMGFDLWDQVYSVQVAGQERRFNDLPGLRAFLADVPGLDLCTTGLLEAAGRYRLQVAMVVHAVAPDEQARVEQVITGEGTAPRGDPGRSGQDRQGRDQQEASVSLGRLIRIFYKGGGKGSDGMQLLSDWFAGQEVRP